mgnify:FL=1
MGWVDRVTPWFAVALIGSAAVWLVFAVCDWIDVVTGSSRRTGVLWGTLAVYCLALGGASIMMFVAIRVARPARRWPPDGAVRALATIALAMSGLSGPLMVLRGGQGFGGVIAGITPLIVYYASIRRPLMDILPVWCGGTWQPDPKKRPPRRGAEVVKHPPRAWDATSGPSAASGGSAAGRTRKKQSRKSKKKRRRG